MTLGVDDFLALFPGAEVISEVPFSEACFRAQAQAILEWNQWVGVLAEDRKIKAEARARNRSSRKPALNTLASPGDPT